MSAPLLHRLRLCPFLCGGRRQLALETLARRQPLTVYQRTGRRPPLRRRDRLGLGWLSRVWTRIVREAPDDLKTPGYRVYPYRIGVIYWSTAPGARRRGNHHPRGPLILSVRWTMVNADAARLVVVLRAVTRSELHLHVPTGLPPPDRSVQPDVSDAQQRVHTRSDPTISSSSVSGQP
jgi:hypothetical protein